MYSHIRKTVLKCHRKITFQRRLISLIVRILNSEVQGPILVEVDSEEESDEEVVHMEDLEVPNAQPELIGKYYWFLRL